MRGSLLLLGAGLLWATGVQAATKLQLVEVITSPWGQAFEKLVTMVQAGQAPDVVEMPERWLSLYANNGQLESLEPYLAKWPEGQTLTRRTLQFARTAGDKAYMLPYGFYIRALFYNTRLFKEAGLAGPPSTMADFRKAAQAIARLPGKYGYCLRGSKGGFTGWQMFMLAMNGSNRWFDDAGNSTFSEPGAVEGFRFMTGLYQDKLAPPDSVNWGFNEVVAGFYSGTCAMLDQDPDALIAVKERMDANDFAVAPMPFGPAGKAFPSIGYAGWSMFASSPNKDAAWQLIAHLESPESNLGWSKFVGVIPIHEGAQEDAFFQGAQFAGWFTELKDERYVLTPVPAHLDALGYFFDVLSVQTAQEALLGKRTAEDVTNEWAAYLSDAQKKWLAQRR